MKMNCNWWWFQVTSLILITVIGSLILGLLLLSLYLGRRFKFRELHLRNLRPSRLAAIWENVHIISFNPSMVFRRSSTACAPTTPLSVMPSATAQDCVESCPIMENEVPVSRTPGPTRGKPKPLAISSILSTSYEREDSYISAAQSIEDFYIECQDSDYDEDSCSTIRHQDIDETDLNVYHQEVIV